MRNMIRLRYAKFPKVYQLVCDRYLRYNDTLRFLDGEERAGRAFVIRPQEPNDIGRIEKDRKNWKRCISLGITMRKSVMTG